MSDNGKNSTIIKGNLFRELAILIAAAFISAPCFAWVWQNPDPQGNPLNRIYFLDNSTGYAVGKAGMILKTADGGSTWTTQTTGITNHLYSIYCPVDATTCFVVGASGKILKTINGGTSWTAQTSGVTTDLNSVYCPTDATTCYATGASGKILKTTSGGTTWTAQTSGITNQLWSVYCPVDATTCYTAGAGGKILKTINSGTTWTAQTSGVATDLNSVYCPVDATTCYATGASGKILKTINGGTAWTSQTSGTANQLWSIHCPVDDTTCYSAGAGGTILNTTTGGASWSALTSGVTSDLLTAYCPAAADTCFAAGNTGAILKTTNSGSSWTALNSGSTPSLKAVHCPAGADTCYAAGPSATVWKTTDGGTNWTAQTGGGNAVYCPIDAATCYSAGTAGSIMKTTTGGAVWTAQASGTANDLYYVHCPADTTTCYATGAGGTILKTTDGGGSWTAQTSGVTNVLYSVSCSLDTLTCFAAGAGGKILKTTNGGTSWTAQTSGTTNDLLSIQCPVDSTTCFAAGAGGKIIKTTTGGTSWAAQTSGVTSQLSSINCPSNATTCYAAGVSGVVLKTTTGGTSWTAQASASSIDLNSVTCPVDASTCYAAGESGAIIKEGSGYVEAAVPTVTDSQAGDDTPRGTNVATYNVDFTDTGGSKLYQFLARACTANSNCGDIKDWTIVKDNVAADTYTTNWSLPASVWAAMTEGTAYISVRVTDGNGNAAESGPVFYAIKDLTVPDQSNWSPAKGSTVNSTSKTITFTTSENADCKWKLTDAAYSGMTGDCTGDGTTSQSCAVTGMVAGAEIVYVSCRDTALNADSITTNEEINYTIDTTPPDQSNWIPAKSAYVNSTSKTITFTTTETADCKWALTDLAYASMTGDCTGDGTTSQSCAVTGMVAGAEIVYVACRDAALNADSITTNEHVNYTIDITLPEQNTWSPAKGAKINATSKTITFKTTEAADCKWSLTDQTYAAMTGDCTGDGTLNQSCAVTGMVEGAEIVYTACRDTALNEDTAATNEEINYTIDITLPGQSAWNPAKSSTINATSKTITFTTTETADCKWSLTDLAYASMTGDCTGDGTTSQSCAVTGMVVGAEIVYAACRDAALNADTVDTNEHLDYTIDTGPPDQSNWSPAKGAYVNSTSKTITFTTTETADCKWALTDIAYGTMTGDCTGDGTTSQSCAVTGMVAGAEIVYVACRDAALNADTIATNEHLNYTVDATLPEQNTWSPAKGAKINATSKTITFKTTENADCKWSLTDQTYAAMTGDCTGDGTTSQSCAVSGMVEGAEIVYTACRDTALNEDTAATNEEINYTIDTTLPGQSAWNPAKGASINATSKTITFTTTETADCKWFLTDLAYASMTGDCTGDGTTSQSCAVSGMVAGAEIVYVSCRDAALNADTIDTNEDINYTIDTTPPDQSAWNPTKGSYINATSKTITFTTTENADCKWALTDLVYASMTGDCTGDGTTSQSCAVTGMVAGAEIVYVSCRDAALNADTAATNEHVNYTIDTTLPEQSAWNPAKGATLDATSKTITFTATENADCKWSLTDLAYASMTGDCTGDGTTSQSCAVSGLPQGAVIIYVSCRDTALNADTAASNEHLNYSVDTVSPTVAITSPAASAALAANAPITGTASDANLSTWYLQYGPGASPTLWKGFATGTVSVTNGTLGTFNTSSLSGAYTIRLVALDAAGRSATATVAVNIQNSATITGTITKYKWTLLSVPVQPAQPAPASMFGAGEYKIFRWDPAAATDAYLSKYKVPAALAAGNGFWIKVYESVDRPYSYAGSLANTAQNFTIQIKNGWNMIGVPFNRDYPWGQVQVKQGVNTYTLTQAATLNLISSTLTGYNNVTNTWVQNTTAATMSPKVGYFVRAYADLDLIFSPGAGMPGGLMRLVRPAFDYNLKISAAAPHSADTDNYIGASGQANPQYDPLDAEEPPRTPDENYTTLYFPREDWTLNAGRYTNDFRASAAKAGDTETWTFNVETTETGETVTLTWDNSALPAGVYSFTLVNLDTGERVDMAASNSYTFTAAGGDAATARFKIEVVKLDAAKVTKTHTLKPGWNLISVPVEPEVTSALAQLGDDLPLLDVYQYYDGALHAADSADIQAGLGYWVHVADNAEIDIEGTPPASEIRVPLAPGWNLIGNPFDSALAWDDNIAFDCGGLRHTLSQAVAAGIVGGALYEYTGERYVASNTLEPWKGYFLKSAGACDVSLTSSQAK